MRALSQFLLVDSPPDKAAVFIPSPAGTATVTVWGMVRATPEHTRQRVLVQWRPPAGGSWRTPTVLTTENPTGGFTAPVTPPGTGLVRLAWTPAGNGAPIYSRAVAVDP